MQSFVLLYNFVYETETALKAWNMLCRMCDRYTCDCEVLVSRKQAGICVTVRYLYPGSKPVYGK